MSDNLFPVEFDSPMLETEENLNDTEPKRTYAFDFEKGEFIKTASGRVKMISDVDAYVQWCYKALSSKRYKHLAYSTDYGQEFDDLIKSGLPQLVIESEIQRIVSETLMVNAETVSVDNFSFNWEGEKVFYECEIITTFGDVATIRDVIEEVI
ncbi:hypothetical protein AJ85_06595 [Alkalihalobacillus alcalophilus ATCC 27647 = CGMCC 1.3604]|uniref:Phage portal protein n=2 Tax=root TaxID=1 RepID=A0A094WGJ9_ALKAL|nr:DUF2634 domain-containing protein [Alkalihalobacillus alcalophilus]AJA42422.1 XkdS [Bacillus phage BalMu-1]KGA96874.1 hypothetical protein BALCAV_0213740 [Alkalihalobacillus alcalophilus ATCC 27647 = CGMCC 1.3604]MED1561164.1 DUF2634 domain-containing protein [Alkalihalobacillus alcalophilus]THG91153.1 hypothetical protein AJ85_06595 [Alkalihalobacillus alcalophilus ATCC 27647 = CGMCC 1.3604]